MGKSPSHKQERVSIPKWAVEQDNFRRSKKYPYCVGTFPDCPAEIKEGIIAEQCRICPLKN